MYSTKLKTINKDTLFVFMNVNGIHRVCNWISAMLGAVIEIETH